MKKKYLSIEILLVIFVINFMGMHKVSGSSKVDSIKSLLQAEKDDNVRGELYYDLGNELLTASLSESLACFYKSKTLFEKLQNTEGMVNSLISISEVFIKMGENQQGVDFALDAVDLSKRNYALLAKSHTQLSIAYSQLQEYELSLKSDKLSLKYHTKLGDTLQIAYDIHNLGSYFFEINKLDSAIVYYKRSIEYLGNKHDELLAFNHNRLGFAYTKLSQYEEAVYNHKKAIAIFKEDSMLFEMALEENYLASVYYMMGKSDSAFFHADNALELTKVIGSFELYKMNYNLFYDLYRRKDDYEKALKYSILEGAYADSLEKQNKESIISSIEIKHEFNEQKQILFNTEKQNKELAEHRRKLIIFGAISFCLLLSCIVILIQKQKKHKLNKKLLYSLDKINMSSKKLLSIIGHDLRDSVGNLKNFTQLMHHELLDNKSIETMVTKFVPMVNSTHGLLDTLLTWSQNNDENFVPKIEQLSVVRLIDMSIEHLSHLALAKQITIDIDAEDVVFYADKNMMLTVLRNLMSNSIKFSSAKSSITVKSKSKSDYIEFTVIDEGVGMTEAQINMVLNKDQNYHSDGTRGERGSGLGISLCSAFVSKHGGNLSIKSIEGKGTEFGFSVPMKANAL